MSIDPREAAQRIVNAHEAVEKAKTEKHPSFQEAVRGLAYYEMHAADRDGALIVALALLASSPGGDGDDNSAAGAPPVDPWQPIETAPKDREILVSDASGDVVKVSWGDCCPGYPNSPRMRWCVAYSFGEHGYHIIEDPTHWMEVPAPPPVRDALCEHDWSEWAQVGRHVERKCNKCGKEQYDD